MSNFRSHNIYEDIENRVPSLPNRVALNHKVELPVVQKSNVLGSRRTVLGSLNLNSNVRVQPRRAAKHGVNYESGAPQVLSDDSLKTFLGTSSLPFTIHDDSSSSSTISRNSSVSSTSSCSTTMSGLRIDSSYKSNNASHNSSKLAGRFPLHQSSSSNILPNQQIRLRTKEKENCYVNLEPVRSKFVKQDKENVNPNGKNQLMAAAAAIKRSSIPPLDSPEAMDMDTSISEGLRMVVDTPAQHENILSERENDIWDSPEYAQDIYKYLREAEICHKPRMNYMQKQTDITANMRWILVDWLVEVSEEYSLHTETLYLAVSYIDRFLSHMSVKRDKLQLVGTTAMFIAAKYEEIYPPDVGQFAYITDNTYRVGQILRMEQLILKVLSFDMAVPTGYLFVNTFAKMCKSNEETLHLAQFLCELSMLDSDPFLRYLPSVISAAAVALANYTQGKETWSENAVQSSKYSLEDLKECYVNLNRVYCRVHEPAQHAIRDKYKSGKWHYVSNLSPREGFPW